MRIWVLSWVMTGFWEGLEDVSRDRGSLLKCAYGPIFVSFSVQVDRSPSMYSLSIAGPD